MTEWFRALGLYSGIPMLESAMSANSSLDNIEMWEKEEDKIKTRV